MTSGHDKNDTDPEYSCKNLRPAQTTTYKPTYEQRMKKYPVRCYVVIRCSFYVKNPEKALSELMQSVCLAHGTYV